MIFGLVYVVFFFVFFVVLLRENAILRKFSDDYELRSVWSILFLSVIWLPLLLFLFILFLDTWRWRRRENLNRRHQENKKKHDQNNAP